MSESKLIRSIQRREKIGKFLWSVFVFVVVVLIVALEVYLEYVL